MVLELLHDQPDLFVVPSLWKCQFRVGSTHAPLGTAGTDTRAVPVPRKDTGTTTGGTRGYPNRNPQIPGRTEPERHESLRPLPSRDRAYRDGETDTSSSFLVRPLRRPGTRPTGGVTPRARRSQPHPSDESKPLTPHTCPDFLRPHTSGESRPSIVAGRERTRTFSSTGTYRRKTSWCARRRRTGVGVGEALRVDVPPETKDSPLVLPPPFTERKDRHLVSFVARTLKGREDRYTRTHTHSP